MGRLDGGDDTFQTAEIFKGVHRLAVRDGHVLRPSGVVEPGVLRPDAGVVQPGGNGVHRGDLAVLVLTEVGFHAVKDAQPPGGDGGRRLGRVHAPPRGLAADESDGGLADKVVEGPDGVGAAAHAGHHRVGQLALLLPELLPDLPGDDGLEVPDDGGERMGTHDRAQAVVGVADAARPLPHSLGDSVLQGGCAGGDGHYPRPQQPHFIDIEGLAPGILLPHEHHALHTHEGGGGGGGHAVLPRSGLRDEPSLAHPLGQERLTQHVVDLMGSRVVQVLPLEIDLGSPQILRHTPGEVQPGGPSGVLVKQLRQLPVEGRVVLAAVIGLLQLHDRVHQRLGYILPAVDAKSSPGHDAHSFRAAATAASILCRSFFFSVSTPLDRSSP